MLYSNVKWPIWSDPERSSINCLVTFEGLGEVPFTANPDDSAEHGRAIYAECVAGKYGDVQEYVEPVQPTTSGAQTL